MGECEKEGLVGIRCVEEMGCSACVEGRWELLERIIDQVQVWWTVAGAVLTAPSDGTTHHGVRLVISWGPLQLVVSVAGRDSTRTAVGLGAQ